MQNYIIDLNPWYCNSSSTFCVSCNSTSNLYTEGLTQMTWFLLDSHSQHAGTNILICTQKILLLPRVMCTQLPPILHRMSNTLIQKFTSQRPTMSFLLKNYSLIELIYLLVGFSKTKSFFWNKECCEKWCKWAKHIYHTQRHNFRKD